jgi:hypothetical protein
MTWSEYYTSVMDEAFRRNGTVIWINPPRPIHSMVGRDPVTPTVVSGSGSGGPP